MSYNIIKYLNFESNRRFGVELEMGHNIPKSKVSKIITNYSKKDVFCTGYRISSNNSYWHVKDDSTCGIFGKNGPKGVEVASYIAQGTPDIDHISFVGRMLSMSGCRTNNNCGYHIHAEVKDLDVNRVGILLAHWLKIENWVEQMLPYQRRNNKYCKPLSSLKELNRETEWKPQDLFIFLSPKNLGTFENEERRVSLNFVNYIKYILFPDSDNTRCTIELRSPEGTLDYLHIRNWIYFFLNFIDSCKNKEMPPNLLPCSNLDEFLFLSGLNHSENTFYIFTKELFDTRIWVLNRIISYGNSTNKRIAKKKVSFLSETTLDNK